MKKTILLFSLLFSLFCSGQTPMNWLLYKKSAVAFSPRDIASLVRWYEADSVGGTFADGDPVSTWTDRSSSALNATSTGTGRPTYRTNIQNGLPALQMDGSNDYFVFTGINATGPNTVILVYKKTASQKFPTLVSQTGPNNIYSWFEWTDGNAYIKSKNCSSGDYSASGNYTSFVTIVQKTTTCGTVTVRANGASKTLTSIAGTGANQNWDAFGYRSSDMANGYIYAIYAFSTELTTDETTNMENYIKGKLAHY